MSPFAFVRACSMRFKVPLWHGLGNVYSEVYIKAFDWFWNAKVAYMGTRCSE